MPLNKKTWCRQVLAWFWKVFREVLISFLLSFDRLLVFDRVFLLGFGRFLLLKGVDVFVVICRLFLKEKMLLSLEKGVKGSGF